MPGRAHPDLVSLELFIDVLERGSISKTAVAHGLSQPSVSDRLRRLELHYGLTLLERGAGGTSPTGAGRAFAKAAAAVLESARHVESTASDLRSALDSQVHVAASFTLAEYLVPHWLAAFQVSQPNAVVELEVCNSSRVLDLLRRGDVALGFVECPTLPDDVESLTIGHDRVAVVCSPTHPLARLGAPLAAEALRSMRLIVREEGSGTRETLELARGVSGAPPLAELGSTTAIKRAVASGLGPAALSVLAVAPELNEGSLVEVPTEGVDLRRSLRAVWPRGRPLRKITRRFLDTARDARDRRVFG